MRREEIPWRRRLRPRRGRSGMVLVMALLALAMMMILLVALFHGTTHQLRGAQSEAVRAREQMMADSAVALVMGQIEQASTAPGQAWMSQPGLVRTYGATSARVPTACYKLYSTTDLPGMTDTSGSLGFLASDVPATWSAMPSLYTDLNAPVQTGGLFGTTIYPIVDAGALTQVAGVSSDTNSVQMPVAWLYELRDGTLGPASKATNANPIVGRIAFWTDDDTCKINLNTAGCGSPWNTPRLNSSDDVARGAMPPAAGEYSAYPGHPATTSLGVLFGTGANPLSPQQLLALTPRYGWGGSQFGTQATTPGQTLAPKTDRLYASVDELAFGPGLSGGQRPANPVGASQPITAGQLEIDRFVLTAHSVAPETTLLGEPRVAIWPVADTAAKITATDRAIASAATVGTSPRARAYYFQRNNPLNTTDDFDVSAQTPSAATSSNLELFNDLVARGQVAQPGYGASLAAKYAGTAWPQIVLEVADYIRGLNSVDPGAPPFAAGLNGVGRGFIVPLTIPYGPGATQVTLRGLGRCPTLSSLTLVFYVCGFGFNDNSVIDYEQTPDDLAGTNWKANFLPGSVKWKKVTTELVRAFVVPCTFQPGCGYPEVSDACQIQIQGLDQLVVSSGLNSGGMGFPSTMMSLPLGTPLKNYPAERAWGGNEGPLAWRVAADAAAGGSTQTYAFAGTNAFAVPMTNLTQTMLDPATGRGWPPTNTLSFAGLTGAVTVVIQDLNGTALQTLHVDLPAFTPAPPYAVHAPTINGECDHADTQPPAVSDPTWTTNVNRAVSPSWYMTLSHRLLTSVNSRAVMIQAGDVTRSVEAATDLRVIAALPTVPATFFQMHPGYQVNQLNAQQGSHAHNIRFADGTSACFAGGTTNSDGTTANELYAWNRLNANARYPETVSPLLTVASWYPMGNQAAYNFFPSAACSAPTGSSSVTMAAVGAVGSGAANTSPGDWDTGPGLAADGAQINLPDSGTSLAPGTAYGSLEGGQIGASTQRTPNALVPSPVIFGSLPAGITPVPSGQPASATPWRGLLFCPYPAADAQHPGFGNASATPPIVPDHLVLDNFWMPTVEPYGISTCIATAGKINLNDQIAPFTYLHRSTALYALLDDLRIPAIPVDDAATYKTNGPPIASVWNPVDDAATVAQIENRFAGNSTDAYLSESEICTVPLVPKGQAAGSVPATQAALDAFWNGGQLAPGGLTGKNLRELPYAQLYSRLTTRSNSYTVHVRVQVLKKLPRDPQQNVWNEGTDLVLGEWRGSYEIERYLDPNASAPVAGQPLGPYKFRIVSSRRFAP